MPPFGRKTRGRHYHNLNMPSLHSSNPQHRDGKGSSGCTAAWQPSCKPDPLHCTDNMRDSHIYIVPKQMTESESTGRKVGWSCPGFGGPRRGMRMTQAGHRTVSLHRQALYTSIQQDSESYIYISIFHTRQAQCGTLLSKPAFLGASLKEGNLHPRLEQMHK